MSSPAKFSSTSAEPRTLRVGLLGFGTVGEGTFRMLQENADSVRRRLGAPVDVARIGVRFMDKARRAESHLFTTDLASIVTDPEIDVIVEAMGGEDPALELIESALWNGKNVVTANKELIAKHGARLIELARRRGLDLHFEAAVGGGIPLIQPLKHQLAGNDVLRMMGVLNGTTNLILTRMAAEGRSFEEALAEAQAQGYAEADPTNDVDGFDTMYKISILAAIAFGGQVPLEQVSREGIRRIGARDIFYADVLGYRIKLLGIVDERGPGRVMVRVHPTLLPKHHPLAHVDDVYNALWLKGDFVGDVMFSGRGAGAFPTASAVVGDVIDVGRSMLSGGSGSAIPYADTIATAPIDDLETRYYIRLLVVDKPNTLGQISTVFGEHQVGLAAMEMRTVGDSQGEIAFLTHTCREADLRRALDRIAELGVVDRLENWIRVEE